jgi:hypothetical protein
VVNIVRTTEDPATGLRQRDRETRSRGGLVELLLRRPDLRGVHAPADVACEATQWGV